MQMAPFCLLIIAAIVLRITGAVTVGSFYLLISGCHGASCRP